MSSLPPSPPNEPAVQPKYWAFISYSSKDRFWGEWLIDALEKYRVPKSLIGLTTGCGDVPPRLYPVFRDRDELRAGSDVEAALRSALMASRYLVVVCSPNSARPESWVSREIAAFKSAGREDAVLALIVEGEPNASTRPGGQELECFAEPLRVHFDATGHPTSVPAEPLAADVRREDRRPRAARRKALLKLVARMIDVDFDTLEQRDRRRRHRLRIAWAIATALILSVVAGLTGYGLAQRRVTLSQQVAKEARGVVTDSPEQAALLSALSYRISPTTGAYESLLEVLRFRPNLVSHIHRAAVVGAVAFDESERLLAVAGCAATPCLRMTVTVYDLATGRRSRGPIDVAGIVTRMTFQAADGRLLMIRDAGEEHEVLALDAGEANDTSMVYRDSRSIAAVATSADGKRYAVALADGEVKVFERGAGKLCIFDTGGGPVRAARFSADGRYLAVATQVNHVTLAELVPCHTQSWGNSGSVADLAFDQSSSELYIAAEDGTVSRGRLPIDPGHSHSFSLVPYSPEGYQQVLDAQARTLAAKHGDHVRVYDLAERRRIEKALEEEAASGNGDGYAADQLREALHEVEVSRMAGTRPARIQLSPLGHWLAAIDTAGMVQLWAARDVPGPDGWLATTDTTQAPNLKPQPEARSPDGRVMAYARDQSEACGGDSNESCRSWTELRLVDAESGQEISRLAGSKATGAGFSGPLAVTFNSDGNVVVQREYSREIWRVAPQDLVRRACHVANRELTAAELDAYVGLWRKVLRIGSPCGERAAAILH